VPQTDAKGAYTSLSWPACKADEDPLQPCEPIAVRATPTAVAPLDALRCGGIAGLACPEGYRCIDDPTDTCDPKNGGNDCIGICVKKGYL
jgi:hypothetical protein